MKSVRILSTIAAVGTFLVIVLGKIVRVTGASESIPDWPLAFGKLIPELTPLVFWEWSHRLVVLLTVLTVITLVVRTFRMPGRLWLYCCASLLLVVMTALIGGMSILYDMHWALAALDQAFAMLFFASLVGLTVWAWMVTEDRERAETRPRGSRS